MEKQKKAYEKPVLQKVRVEVRSSVLAFCHTSVDLSPAQVPGAFGDCRTPLAVNSCVFP